MKFNFEKNDEHWREMLQPLGESLRRTFIEAIILRLKVNIALAEKYGAEAEDMEELVAQTIHASSKLTTKFLDELGQVERVDEIAK